MSSNVDQHILENFLLECLSKKGQRASVLFSAIDINKISSDCANKLLNEYENIFDFHFINKLYLKNIYEKQNEVIKSMEKTKREQEVKIHQIEEENQNMKNDIILLKNEIISLKNLIENIKSYQVFPYDESNENGLMGIIRYLTSFSGGNIHDNGVVNITSSTVYNNDVKNWHSKNIVDLDNLKNSFASNQGENDYIIIDFKNRKVHPTHYQIRSRNDFCNNYHPCNWKIEGSVDGNNWKILDDQMNVKSLIGLNITKTFKIKTQLLFNECFKYLKITQTGKHSNRTNYLVFSAIEFYGYLYLK